MVQTFFTGFIFGYLISYVVNIFINKKDKKYNSGYSDAKFEHETKENNTAILNYNNALSDVIQCIEKELKRKD